MARISVKKVIDEAFELIGVKSVDADLTVDAKQGLDILNRRLADYSNDTSRIASIQSVIFNTVQGQASYTIGKNTSPPDDVDSAPIAELDYAQLLDDSFLRPLEIIQSSTFYNNSRNTTTQGKPNKIFFEKQLTNSKVTFISTPDKVYSITLICKLDFLSLTFDDDLEGVVPSAWDNFIIYEVAYLLRDKYPSNTWDISKQEHYDRLKNLIQGGSKNDLSIRPDGRLTPSTPYKRYDIFSG